MLPACSLRSLLHSKMALRHSHPHSWPGLACVQVSTGATAVLSGNGYERNQNGSSPLSTSWAQPSGLSRDLRVTAGAGRVWVADSESSSVRLLDLETGGSTAAAGGDPLFADNLFRCGHTNTLRVGTNI